MCLPSYRIPAAVRHGHQRAPKPNLTQHRVILLAIDLLCLPSYRIPASVRHGRQRAPKPNLAQHRVILLAID